MHLLISEIMFVKNNTIVLAAFVDPRQIIMIRFLQYDGHIRCHQPSPEDNRYNINIYEIRGQLVSY
jgi:hypothetical protein